MDIRTFCKNATFLLTALDGSQMVTKPNNFNMIPEKFTADPTYQMAVAAGVIETFETTKQGAKIERTANENPKRNEPKVAKADDQGKAAEDK